MKNWEALGNSCFRPTAANQKVGDVKPVNFTTHFGYRAAQNAT